MKAHAQQASPATSSETIEEGFVPVVGEPERTSAEGSVIAAYLIMWAIMMFFLWRTLRVQARLSADTSRLIDELSKGKS